MIRQYALEGLPFRDIFIFDVHAHLGSFAPMQIGNGDAAGIVKTMDQMGVATTCLSSLPAIKSDCTLGNQLVKEATLQFPGRIYGYLTATPYDETYPFEDYFKGDSPLFGIKIHAAMNDTAINNPAYLPYLEFANERNLPVLFHAWEPTEVSQIAALAENFRNCPLIIAHCGFTGYQAKLEAIKTVAKYEHVFLDTAHSSTYDGALEWIVSKVGADRILFGSDVPFFDIRHTLGKLALSHLSEEEKLKIVGLNAKHLFHL